MIWYIFVILLAIGSGMWVLVSLGQGEGFEWCADFVEALSGVEADKDSATVLIFFNLVCVWIFGLYAAIVFIIALLSMRLWYVITEKKR